MNDLKQTYILDRKTLMPKPEPDPVKWSQWMGRAGNCGILQNQIWPCAKGHPLVSVSTSFIGKPYEIIEGYPMLFESIAFIDRASERRIIRQWHTCTGELAIWQHKRLVAVIERWRRRFWNKSESPSF